MQGLPTVSLLLEQFSRLGCTETLLPMTAVRLLGKLIGIPRNVMSGPHAVPEVDNRIVFQETCHKSAMVGHIIPRYSEKV